MNSGPVSVMMSGKNVVIVVDADEVPAGVEYRVREHGTNSFVAGSHGIGGREWVGLDPLAYGQTSYELVYPGAAGAMLTGQADIPATATHEFRDVRRKTTAAFRWATPHAVDSKSGVTLVWPAGSKYPVARSQVAPVGAFTVNAYTKGKATAALAALVERGEPLVLEHSRKVCQVPDCNIPPVQLVYVTAFPCERTERIEVQETAWKLECVPADPDCLTGGVNPDGSQNGIPPVTWGDVAHMGTWEDVSQNRDSWGAVVKGV